ncbi:hypothetical protein [Candidatus Nanohalococcus occultus]|uniref:Uncharacterized protein n=1 Tax=Candidatus Nanohalococcus occultus TaxID=2978047 RepID=A0ABY8CIH4_9ARCH|nr:hypothetical protein SVXNc_0674 [Candidatus Nanohaloarchaeota archaeon SVXNc]
MKQRLEKPEARDLLEEIGWTYLLPENVEQVDGSPTDYDFDVRVERAVGVGKTDVQPAYKVSAYSGRHSAFKTFTADTEVGSYLQEVCG